MNRVMLANSDYWTHTSSEGHQLQAAMNSSGWILAGSGFDERQDVEEILEAYSPDVILVADKRDWDPTSRICYNRKVGFSRLRLLGKRQIPTIAVVKDAGGSQAYHQLFCEEVEAAAVLTYYHEQSVRTFSPFLDPYKIVRTFHTIDPENVPPFLSGEERRGVVVSGATGSCYPIRNLAFAAASDNGWTAIRHPGYGNRACHTPTYLHAIGRFKVHIATASTFGFALRKIIESVACGCIPVTDLPAYDELPMIDGALVRIPPGCSREVLEEAVARALDSWDYDERFEFARLAKGRYDYRWEGARIDLEIQRSLRLKP